MEDSQIPSLCGGLFKTSKRFSQTSFNGTTGTIGKYGVGIKAILLYYNTEITVSSSTLSESSIATYQLGFEGSSIRVRNKKQTAKPTPLRNTLSGTRITVNHIRGNGALAYAFLTSYTRSVQSILATSPTSSSSTLPSTSTSPSTPSHPTISERKLQPFRRPCGSRCSTSCQHSFPRERASPAILPTKKRMCFRSTASCLFFLHPLVLPAPLERTRARIVSPCSSSPSAIRTVALGILI